MKFRATILVTLLTVLFAVSSGEAMKLDAPHNRDNGIGCYDCHSEDPRTPSEDYWWNAYPGSDPDFSLYNWVCNRCHSGVGATFDPSKPWHEGPFKVTHSKSTTDPNNPTAWTTECVDCHDPHFQEQVRWAGDPGFFYIAEGTFDTVFSPVAPTAPDTYHPTGTTSFGVNSFTFVADFDPAACDWSQKCKSTTTFPNYNARAKDLSRGFIMVADKLNTSTSPTYEIIDAQPQGGGKYILTVKGDIRFVADPGGIQFGVIYGGLLNKHVVTPAVTGDGRPVMSSVKFFTPKKVAGGAGGPVDLTAGATEPVGMCQVCHTATSWFNETDPTSTSHYDSDGRACYDCHAIEDGGSPVIEHASYITDTNNCNGCHAGYAFEPDTKHIGRDTYLDCQTCHTDPAVDPNGAPYLRTAGTVNTPAVEQRVPYFSNGTLHLAVDCDACHNATYGVGDYTLGHPDVTQEANKVEKHNAAIAPQSLCVSCHGALTMLSTGDDIVVNAESPGGHADKCVLCHLTVTPPVELTAGAQIAQDNANLVTPVSTPCGECHTTYFNAHTHDHSTTVLKNSGISPPTVNCNSNDCHNAPAGNGPFVNAGEVHIGGCLTCHRSDNGAPFGSAATGWPSGWNALPASGECITCHTTYFDSHEHGVVGGTAEHTVSFVAATDKTGGGTACYMCHDDAGLGKGAGALGTWASIIIEHQSIAGMPGQQNACEVCHNSSNVSGLANTPLPAEVYAAIANGGAVTCTTCHKPKLGPHGSHPTAPPYDFVWTDTTKASCGGGGVAGVCHDWVNNENVVLDIHGNGTLDNSNTSPVCKECHVDAVISSDYSRRTDTVDGLATQGTAGDRQRDCLVCHDTATHSKPFMHHEKNGTVAFTVTSCAAKCHNGTLGHPGNHTALVANALEVPNVQRACVTCHDATVGSADNVPVDGTPGNKVHDACTQCHLINATTKMVELVAPSGSVSTMDNSDGTTLTNNGGGTCTECHTGYFEAHTHHTPAKGINKVAINLLNGTLPNYIDQSWDDGSGVTGYSCQASGLTTGCHQDYEVPGATGAGNALNSWAGIQYEHDRVTANVPPGNSEKDGSGSCVNCHYNSRAGGVNTDKFPGATSTTDIVANPSGLSINCADCHFGKLAPAVHGLTYVDHFEVNTTQQMVYGWVPITASPECSLACHYYEIGGTDDAVAGDDPNDIIIGMHNNNCGACHASQPALVSSPNLVQFNNTDSDGDTVKDGATCAECHLSGLLTPADHEVHPSSLATQGRHDKITTSNASLGDNCFACHAEMGPADIMNRHMPFFASQTTTPDECLVCHDPAAYSADKSIVPAITAEPALTVINLGKANGGSNQIQYCESCHTAQDVYLLHAMTNSAADTASVHNKLTADATCATGCHTTLATELQILTLHTGGCLQCHAAPVSATKSSTGVIAAGMGAGGAATTCVSCHVYDILTPDYNMHGMTNTDVAAAHGNIATDLTCTPCHVSTTQEQKLALHTGGCGTCHEVPVSNGVDSDDIVDGGQSAPDGTGVNGIVNCTDCHVYHATTPSYKMHGMNDADAAADHDHLGAALTDPDCSGCHVMADAQQKLALHTGGCGTCHNVLASGTPPVDSDNIVDAGKTPSINDQDCVNCHVYDPVTPANSSYLMHGLTDATAATIHDKMITSNPGTDTDCANCHEMSGTVEDVKLKIIDLHTGTLNPDTGGNCLTCHDIGDVNLVASRSVVSAGQGAGTNQECVNCHDTATDRYLMHGLTFGGGDDAATDHDKLDISTGTPGTEFDCAGCHVMSTPAARLELHNKPGVYCTGCHNNAIFEPANAVIVAGWDDTPALGAEAKCEECHTAKNVYRMHGLADDGGVDDVGADHDTMVNENVTSSSACGSCHTAATPLARIQLHTQVTTTCLDCHNYPGGPLVKSEIDAAIANGISAGTVYCDACHTAMAAASGWYNHLDPGHSPAILVDNTAIGSPNVNNCVDCHNEATQVAVHDSVPSPVGGAQSCTECHNPDSGMKGSAAVYTIGAFECNQCHTAYFDSHIIRGTGSTGHTTAQNINPTISIGDWAQGTGSEQLCHDCHYDSEGPPGSSTALDTWDEILVEHQTVAGTSGLNSCEVCHNSIYTDVDTVAFPLATTVQDVIKAGGAVRCLSCHYSKRSPNGHGGHDSAHFDWTTPGTAESCGASTCHDSTKIVVTQVHPACIDCHNTPDNAAGGNGNTGLGDLGVGTAAVPPANATTHEEDCNVCHSLTGHVYSANFGSAHLRTTDHDGVGINIGCMGSNACHQGSTGAAVAATLHTACEACHFNILDNGNFTSGPTGVATGGSGDCASCHSAPINYTTDYTNHLTPTHAAMTNTATCISGGCHDQANYVDAGTPGVGVHDMFDNVSATYACDLCHTTITGVLKNGTRGYGNATDMVGECTACHTAYTTWDTGHDAANLDHAALTDTTSCVSANCHTQADYIDAGTPGVGVHDMYDNASATFACDRCHNLTNGVLKAGPNGSGTAVGGAGDCASCHSAINTDFAGAIGHTGYTHADITVTAGCSTASCHSGDIITAVHLGCGSCHLDVTTPTTDGTLIGSAATANPAANGSVTQFECSDCHTAGHNAELDHDNIHKTWTTANGATEDCYSCHPEMGGATVVFKDIGSGGIDQLHNRGNVTCDSCHNYSGTRAGTLALNVTNTIDKGKSTGLNLPVNCEDCHVYNDITSHDAVNAHNRTMLEIGNYEREGLSCGRCHHGNVAIEHVMGGTYCTNLAYTDQATCETNGFFWNDTWGVAKGKIEMWTTPPANKCTICHDDGAGGPSSNTVVDAAVTLGKSTGSDSPVGCFQCHQPSNPELFHYDPDNGGPLVEGNSKYGVDYDLPKGHHDGTQVLSGNCVYCHTDPRANPALNFPTPAVLPCRNCHAVEDDAGQQLTIYRNRNRGQDIAWNGSKISGTGAWTLTFAGICADTTYADQPSCESAGLDWRPARAVANTEPSGTCSVGGGIYTDKKWDCINIGGGKWTYDEQPGTGVEHQWTILSGRGGLGGAVQTYGMCIFCHKMGPYHAMRLTTDDFPTAGAITGLRYGRCSTSMEVPRVDYGTESACTAAGGTWAKGVSGVLDVNYLDGFMTGPFHPGPGRSELAVMHEVSAYEDNYFHAGTYDDAAKDDYKGIWQGISTADGVSDVSLSYAMAVYQPQQVCSDPRWKNSNGGQTKCESTFGVWNSDSNTCSDLRWTNQVDCESNVGNWDHGDQAKKYIPSWWIGGAEAEYARFVPVIESAPATVTITNNGTSFTEVGTYEYVAGSSFSFNVNVTTCTDATCSVYAVVAGQDYPLTYQGGTNWTASSGAIVGYWPAGGPHEGENKHLGSVRQATGVPTVDVHYVAVKNNPGNTDHRQTLGYLNVRF